MITCTFESGGTGTLRHVTGAAFIFNQTNDQLLLAKRSGKYSEPFKWGPPGGYMSRDETTAEMVIRETLEETGWRIKATVLLRINDNPFRPKEDKQNVDFVYLGEAIEKTGDFDTEEIGEVQWFPLTALPPAGEMAFDHNENMQLALHYVKKQFPVPLLGKIPVDFFQ
jgi:8-oxo-dGTP diphosphatase